MSINLVALIADGCKGGTFVNWTLHYLAGHEQYYSVANEEFLAVTDNPLTDTNAHGFRPNQPVTAEQFNNILGSLKQCKSQGNFNSIYFHNWAHTTESFDPTMAAACEEIQQLTPRVVVLSNRNGLYNATWQRRIDTVLWQHPDQNSADPEVIWQDFVTTFFADSIQVYEQAGLTEVWDRREFMALNLDWSKQLNCLPNINQTKPHFLIDTMDLWNRFDSTVPALFQWLELEIRQDRWNNWLQIYHDWQHKHTNPLKFLWYFETIINNILAGNYMDLQRFNLDIVQEAAIQRELIVKHNFNLKTWQLEKFVDTQQLHNLLEPNIHLLNS